MMQDNSRTNTKDSSSISSSIRNTKPILAGAHNDYSTAYNTTSNDDQYAQYKDAASSMKLNELNHEAQRMLLKTPKSGNTMLESSVISMQQMQATQKTAGEEGPKIETKAADRVLLNLEDILTQEEKLWNLLEGIRSGNEIRFLCEEWWEITDVASVSNIERLFKNEKMRVSLRVAQILEGMSVCLLQLLGMEGTKTTTLHSYLKNLIFYVHQNFLLLAELIIKRISADSVKNSWTTSLQKIIVEKKAHKPNAKSHTPTCLTHNNDIIANILKNITKLKPHRKIYDTIGSLLKQADTIRVDRVRTILYNTVSNNAAKQSSAGTTALPPISGAGGGNSTSSGTIEFPLSQIEPPFLPKLDEEKAKDTYTLVLDLDETLVHYIELGSDSHFLIRPGAQKFLEEMAKHYELVIFTAAMQDYADWVLDQIDPNHLISYRLYRQHTMPSGTFFLKIYKDLSKIGRDLSRVIIVDNMAENFKLQIDNGIFITTWIDDMEDRALEEITPLLQELVLNKVKDVRKGLRLYRDQMLRQISQGIKLPHLNFSRKALEQ